MASKWQRSQRVLPLVALLVVLGLSISSSSGRAQVVCNYCLEFIRLQEWLDPVNTWDLEYCRELHRPPSRSCNIPDKGWVFKSWALWRAWEGQGPCLQEEYLPYEKLYILCDCDGDAYPELNYWKTIYEKRCTWCDWC